MITLRKAESVEDFSFVKSVLIDDDEMWERSSDDYSKKDDSFMKNKSIMWLIAKNDSDNAGVFAVSAASNTVLSIHVHIPKQHRGRKTKMMGRIVLRWIKENSVEQYQKINTKIPVIYKDVIRYAHSLGFKDEGIDRLSVMKNGKLIDRLNLGITFGEIA